MSGPRPAVHRVGYVPARVLAIAAGAGLATAMTVSATSAASALTLPTVPVTVPSVNVPPVSAPSVPLPVPSVSAPKLPAPSVSIPSVPALPLPSVPAPKLPVPSVPPVSAPSLPVPVSTAPVPGASSAPGLPSAPGVPAPVGSVLSGVQSGVKSGVGQLSGGLTGITGIAGVTGGTTGSLLNLGVNASPIATACVQAKGTGTAIANVTVTVAGHNITAPLVQALPGVLAPCPSGAIPGSPGVGASAGGGLVGACVQATSKAPLDASILVLDTELVGTLTKAGVPLQQVVVPCPKGVTGGQPGTGGTGGAGGTNGSSLAGGASGAAGAGQGAAAGRAGSAAAGGKGPGGSGGSCAKGSGGWSSLNAETLDSAIPSNVPQTLPWILLALALLGRRRLARAVTTVRTFRGFRRLRLEA